MGWAQVLPVDWQIGDYVAMVEATTMVASVCYPPDIPHWRGRRCGVGVGFAAGGLVQEALGHSGPRLSRVA